MNQSFPMSEFSILIKQNTDKAYNVAYRLTGNEQSARELVQQAFMNALRHIETYERSRPFEPWLHRIMKNLFLDDVRKLKNRRTVSLDGPSPREDVAWEQLIPGPDRTPLEQMEKRELHALARRALNLLPDHYQLAVTLCDVEKFTYERIALRLKCPIGTIRSRIHQGRILLREGFKKLELTAEAAFDALSDLCL